MDKFKNSSFPTQNEQELYEELFWQQKKIWTILAINVP